jgi:ergothioneine biosynthesis protein EgtB
MTSISRLNHSRIDSAVCSQVGEEQRENISDRKFKQGLEKTEAPFCLKYQMREWMTQCRADTLALFDGMEHDTLCQQAHPDFSPIGWHLGHIAFTESLWLLEHCAGQDTPFPHYRRLFAADGLPKSERCHLPTLAEIQEYLEVVRSQVFQYLDIAPLETQERLWRFILQHESQHCETIAIVLTLLKLRAKPELPPPPVSPSPPSPFPASMLCIPAGTFQQGCNTTDALDNERPAHSVYLGTYWIDRVPVTRCQYRVFMEAAGYHNPQWWSATGWEWLQTAKVTAPLYWLEDPAWDNQPVCGVSWYEADAYARFTGKRLPTEAEWEKAACWHLNCSMLGNIWEWTASWFTGYPGFEPYPYRGYSQAYFDQQHRVLRGGSWVTRPWTLRCTFRNWYHPHIREVFAGFRCASDNQG